MLDANDENYIEASKEPSKFLKKNNLESRCFGKEVTNDLSTNSTMEKNYRL